MCAKKNRVEFLKYCSLIKAMTNFDKHSDIEHSLFENINYNNESVRKIHKTRFNDFCKINLNLIDKLDSHEKRYIEKGKNDLINFIIEYTDSTPVKKTVFIKTINHFIKRNNIDNNHMIFKMLNRNPASIDFIKTFSSFVNRQGIDNEENVIVEKFFKKINTYSL